MVRKFFTSSSTLSGRSILIVGAAAVALACFLITNISPPADKGSKLGHGPVSTAAEAVAVAEECMKNSGYAGEPARDLWPRGNEIFVLLNGHCNLVEMRASRALLYEAKAVAYEDLGNRWIVGFPNRGGGDLGVQVMVGRDGSLFLLHDPPSRMSLFKCKIDPEPIITRVHSHVGSK